MELDLTSDVCSIAIVAQAQINVGSPDGCANHGLKEGSFELLCSSDDRGTQRNAT